MKKLLMMISLLMLGACKPVQLVTPTQADVSRVSQKFPGITVDELNEGKSIFENNCDLCHRLKNPVKKNEKQWHRIVPKMVRRVNWIRKENGIDSTSKQILLKYLITMSSAPEGEK